MAGGRRVKEVLRELDIVPETVLVIRGDTLVTGDQVVADDETIELRPVMSGGLTLTERAAHAEGPALAPGEAFAESAA